MKHNYVKLLFNKVLLGAAIIGSGIAINACTDDHIEDLHVQSATSTSEATVLQGKNGDVIPGKYIVVLKAEEAGQQVNRRAPYNEVSRQAQALGQAILKENGIPDVALEHVYGSSIAGFSAAMSNRDVALLRADKRVKYIEPDRIITLNQGKSPVKGGGDSNTQPSQTTPWGIVKAGGAVNYSGNAVAWVIDTGIDLTHPDLNINATDNRHMSVFTTNKDSSPNDGNGHGTHVAGTIAAKDNAVGVVGVAAGAPVIAVKVLDSRGSGTISGVIKGVDYVGANASNGDVANMSLGGGKSTALNDAVIAASGSAAGSSKSVFFTVAAGNDGKHAGNYSPASAEGANIFTISAYDANYNAPSWSNYGVPPVDYSCPGVSINSTWKDGSYRTISGTSMAAPHMAGIIMVVGKAGIKENGTLKNETASKKYGPVAVHTK